MQNYKKHSANSLEHKLEMQIKVALKPEEEEEQQVQTENDTTHCSSTLYGHTRVRPAEHKGNLIAVVAHHPPPDAPKRAFIQESLYSPEISTPLRDFELCSFSSRISLKHESQAYA